MGQHDAYSASIALPRADVAKLLPPGIALAHDPTAPSGTHAVNFYFVRQVDVQGELHDGAFGLLDSKTDPLDYHALYLTVPFVRRETAAARYLDGAIRGMPLGPLAMMWSGVTHAWMRGAQGVIEGTRAELSRSFGEHAPSFRPPRRS